MKLTYFCITVLFIFYFKNLRASDIYQVKKVGKEIYVSPTGKDKKNCQQYCAGLAKIRINEGSVPKVYQYICPRNQGKCENLLNRSGGCRILGVGLANKCCDIFTKKIRNKNHGRLTSDIPIPLLSGKSAGNTLKGWATGCTAGLLGSDWIAMGRQLGKRWGRCKLDKRGVYADPNVLMGGIGGVLTNPALTDFGSCLMANFNPSNILTMTMDFFGSIGDAIWNACGVSCQAKKLGKTNPEWRLSEHASDVMSGHVNFCGSKLLSKSLTADLCKKGTLWGHKSTFPDPCSNPNIKEKNIFCSNGRKAKIGLAGSGSIYANGWGALLYNKRNSLDSKTLKALILNMRVSLPDRVREECFKNPDSKGKTKVVGWETMKESAFAVTMASLPSRFRQSCLMAYHQFKLVKGIHKDMESQNMDGWTENKKAKYFREMYSIVYLQTKSIRKLVNKSINAAKEFKERIKMISGIKDPKRRMDSLEKAWKGLEKTYGKMNPTNRRGKNRIDSYHLGFKRKAFNDLYSTFYKNLLAPQRKKVRRLIEMGIDQNKNAIIAELAKFKNFPAIRKAICDQDTSKVAEVMSEITCSILSLKVNGVANAAKYADVLRKLGRGSKGLKVVKGLSRAGKTNTAFGSYSLLSGLSTSMICKTKYPVPVCDYQRCPK